MLTSAQRALLEAKAPNDNFLGFEVHRLKNVVKAVYDFSVDGGAVSSINLKDEFGNLIIFPIGAIITNVTLDVITPCTTSASGTLAIDSQGAGDLLAATAAASVTGKLAGVPVGTAATWVKISSSAKQLKATIATGALTAGKAYIFIEYLLSAAT